MEKQIFVTIGREFGSAGHIIGETLAKRLGINFYDRKIMDEIAKQNNISDKELAKYDEKPKSRLFSRTVNGYSNSLEDILFEMQCKFINDKADAGESFVLIGRCGEKVLGNRDGHISIFVLGDKEEKIARVMDVYSLDRDKAYEMMRSHDKFRKAYHNSRCESKWGDSRTYDLCINSSKLGVETTVDLLEDYVKTRVMGMKK